LITLSQMQAFVETIEQGSFTAAARRLKVSKVQVSRLVSSLEEHLKMQLLRRSTRALTPTEAGRIYYSEVSVILKQIGRLEQRVSERAEAPSGRLRIATPRIIAPILTDILDEFAKQYSLISYSVLADDRAIDLVGENIDVAVRIGFWPDSSLKIRRIGRMCFRFAAAPAYLEQFGEPALPQDLADHRGIWNLVEGHSPVWFKYSDNHQLMSFDAVFESDDYNSVLNAAVNGMGILEAPDILLRKLVDSGKLQWVLSQWVGREVPISCVHQAHEFIPERTRAFLDYLSDTEAL